MTDRDRLAADLHEGPAGDLHRDKYEVPPCSFCEDEADRLIALGWTRLDDAIEAEARADANARLSAAHQAGIEVGRNEERARIRAAVELLFAGWIVDQPDDEEALELERAAVLAIIDREAP